MGISTVNSELRITVTGGLTLIQKAIRVLRNFGANAHVYMPGVGFMNGLQAGNYLESTGQTPLTVDQPTGMVLDGVGNVITPAVSDFGVTYGYTNTLSSVSSTGFTTTATTTVGRVYINLATTIGTTYSIRGYMAVAGTSGVMLYGKDSINGLGVILATSPVINQATAFSLTFTATTASSCFLFNGAAIGQSFAVSGIVITTGIHASQATTANKPILRRGAVNLLTYSQDFTNVAWGKFNMAAAANSATRLNTSTSFLQSTSLSIQIGSSGTLAVLAKPKTLGGAIGLRLTGTYPNRADAVFNLNTGVVIGSAASTFTGNVATVAGPDSSGYYLCALSATVAGSTAVAGLLGPCELTASVGGWEAGSSTLSDCFIGGAAVFPGTFTAQQIQALGGIPLTTTAPASTALGPYYWEFDGSNDSLVLGSVPFQISDDFALIAGASQTSATQCAVISVDNGAANAAMLFLNSRVPTFWINAGGTSVGPACGAQQPLGAVFVASGVKRGSNAYARLNGVQGGTNSTSAVGTGSYTAGRIGYNTVASGYLSGAIYPVIAIKGTVSDAQLLTLEKWVASASGITI